MAILFNEGSAPAKPCHNGRAATLGSAAGRRIFVAMRVGLIVAMLGGLLVAPAAAQARSSSDAPTFGGPPNRKQTLTGAVDRADRKLEWFYRGIEMREQNF